MRPSLLCIIAVYWLRMVGIFMALPLASLYAVSLKGSTPLLMGLAMGIYGLTQGVMQLPCGRWSDRYGRKRIVLIGLLLFGLGSALNAMATSIGGFIAGRALQGLGAIGSALSAWVADLTPPDQRTLAMAFLGVGIGIAFAVAMSAGPILSHHYGIRGIFWSMTAFSVVAMVVTHYGVATPTGVDSPPVPPVSTLSLLCMPVMQILNVGVFMLHAILAALLLVLPLFFTDMGLPVAEHSHIYAPALGSGFVVSLLVLLTERKLGASRVMVMGMAFVFLGLLLINSCLRQAPVLSLAVYFTGFNVLEAVLPASVSRHAPTHVRGAAMGTYASLQFLGIFLGGAGGGVLYRYYHFEGVFLLCLSLMILWTVLVGIRSFFYGTRC